jgi:hypothetical protein
MLTLVCLSGSSLNSTFLLSADLLAFAAELVPLCRQTVASVENKELKVIAVLLAVGVITLIRIFQQNVSCSSGTTLACRLSDC